MNSAATHHVAGAELSLGQCAALACAMEATAPKPGNVHRGCDFEDMTYPDFIVAAISLVPIFDAALSNSVGKTVLAAVEATLRSVATNPNLGTILLIAPLAKVPRDIPCPSGVGQVLRQLTPEDARDVYHAIVLAQPGGMGKVEEHDISGEPPQDLIAAMRLAQHRDMVARQYAEDFTQVLADVVPSIGNLLDEGLSLSSMIVRLHLELLCKFPDSLIARQSSVEVAHQAATYAQAVLKMGRPGDENYEHGLADFDFWLRADGHRRNPGTTADLIAAGLFVALRDGIIKPPFRLAY